MAGVERRGEAEFNNGSTTGFVCTEQRADKCRLLLTIYTLLHTPAPVHVTQKCTHAAAVALQCLFSLCVSITTLRLAHTHTHVFTVHQCISVNQCKRERWGSPCKHITLTGIWPLSSLFKAGCVRMYQRRESERVLEVWSGFTLL